MLEKRRHFDETPIFISIEDIIAYLESSIRQLDVEPFPTVLSIFPLMEIDESFIRNHETVSE